MTSHSNISAYKIQWLPSFPDRAGLAFDGGLTNDQPCASAHTITVSCLNRDADVNAQRHRESVDAPPLFALHEMVRTPPFERVWAIAGGAEVGGAVCQRRVTLRAPSV
jgi:hypothetical protein